MEKNFLLIILISVFLIPACTSSTGSTPRSNARTVSTPEPSATPLTAASPVATATPTPTPTPDASETVTPTPTPQAAGPLEAALWGGEHIEMTTKSNGAYYQLDCGYGSITQTIMLDSNGHFHGLGNIVQEGGPTPTNSSPLPAEFDGTVNGDTMTITIFWESEGQPFQATFHLQKGQNGSTFRCE